MRHGVFLVVAVCLGVGTANAQEQEDVFVHPFFSHMALADPVGAVSFRFTGMERREGETVGGDVGLHIEAGLLPRLGIHLRSDGIKSERFSEVMVMYNAFTTGWCLSSGGKV